MNRRSLTHHTFPFDANIVLLGLAWRSVDHRELVSIEETLATGHAIQFALVRPARVRDPTIEEKRTILDD